MNTSTIVLMTVGAMVGAASAYLGSFMVIKRMSLVGDALSHVALPGIAVALLIGINPMLGALAALVLATIAIWFLSRKSEIYPEALVGVFFTTSLALGLLITPEPELLEALFGNIDHITPIDAFLAFTLAGVIILVTYLISKKLLLGVISEDLAKAQGIKTAKTDLIYLLLVALVVALGVKFLGTLLTGAMVIIPAVTAKNISKSFILYNRFAVIFGIISAAFGIFIAKSFNFASGPTIVLSAVALFAMSYLFKKK